MVDVAAHDDHGADFGRRPPESRKKRGEKAEAAVPNERRYGAQRSDAQRPQLFIVFLSQVLDGLAAESCNDRRDQHGLRDNHGSWRIKEPKAAHGPGVGEQQVDDQPDHHRRQAHERVNEEDDEGAPTESCDGDKSTDRQAQ